MAQAAARHRKEAAQSSAPSSEVPAPEPRRGREARRAARAQRGVASIPYITRATRRPRFSPKRVCLSSKRPPIHCYKKSIEFRDYPAALERFRSAGCDIKGERVSFPRGLARKLCASAPQSFVQHARNPERNVVIGGNATVFAPNYGSPFVHDLDKGDVLLTTLLRISKILWQACLSLALHLPLRRNPPSLSICPSTSGISKWSMRICAIPTKLSRAR